MKDMDLFQEFTKQLKLILSNETDKITNFKIALSGGLDSVVLLHLFYRMGKTNPEIKIVAHHVDHGLSNNAQKWMNFCKEFSNSLEIDFTFTSLNLVRTNRTSLEALARDARYECLTKSLTKNAALVTAHHQDDQIETVLLALKRGSGPTGLQGIKSYMKISKGALIRPLLNFSRNELEAYATKFDLKWVTDESNFDEAFDRNFLRHQISPLLKERWPSIGKTISRTAKNCQELQELLDEVALQDFDKCSIRFLDQDLLNIEALKTLSNSRRNNLLRFWFKLKEKEYPSAKQLDVIWNELALAKIDAKPKLQLNGFSVQRYREQLFFVVDDLEKEVNSEPKVWDGEERIYLKNRSIKLSASQNIYKATQMTENKLIDTNSVIFMTGQRVEICFRDQFPSKLTCKPSSRTQSRSVKKLLHEYMVPTWLRDHVPFVFIDGKLAMAVGLWICEEFQPIVDKQSLTVRFI